MHSKSSVVNATSKKKWLRPNPDARAPEHLNSLPTDVTCLTLQRALRRCRRMCFDICPHQFCGCFRLPVIKYRYFRLWLSVLGCGCDLSLGPGPEQPICTCGTKQNNISACSAYLSFPVLLAWMSYDTVTRLCQPVWLLEPLTNFCFMWHWNYSCTPHFCTICENKKQATVSTENFLLRRGRKNPSLCQCQQVPARQHFPNPATSLPKGNRAHMGARTYPSLARTTHFPPQLSQPTAI